MCQRVVPPDGWTSARGALGAREELPRGGNEPHGAIIPR